MKQSQQSNETIAQLHWEWINVEQELREAYEISSYQCLVPQNAGYREPNVDTLAQFFRDRDRTETILAQQEIYFEL